MSTIAGVSKFGFLSFLSFSTIVVLYLIVPSLTLRLLHPSTSPLLVLVPISGVTPEEEARYDRVPFDIFLSVSFSNHPLDNR